MTRIPSILRGRAAGLAAGLAALAVALLGAAAAPSDAAAQRDRRATFLSDRPAPRDGCRVSPAPSRLPTLDVLADSAALTAGLEQLAMQLRMTEDTTYVLYSVGFDADGKVTQVRDIEYYAPRELLDPLKALVFSSIRQQRGSGYLRIRIHPGTRRVLIGRSEVCEPRGPNRVQIQRRATEGRDSYQPFRARVLVSAEGRAINVTKTRGSGDFELDDFAVRMLTGARYAPGIVDGVATQMEYDQDVRYTQ